MTADYRGRADAIPWEEMDCVPPSRSNNPYGSHGDTFGQKLTLRPGQILRRPANNKGYAAGYHTLFKRRGLTDYHAATRYLEEEEGWYVYIWRDDVS